MAFDLIAGKQTDRNYALGVASDTGGIAEVKKAVVKKSPYILLGLGAAVVGWFGHVFNKSGGRHGGLPLAGGAALLGAGTYSAIKRKHKGVVAGVDESGAVATPREVAVEAWAKKTGMNPEKVSIAVKEVEKNKFGIATRDDAAQRIVYGTVDVSDAKSPKIAVDTDRKYKNVKETFYILDKYSV
ncbi:MAG: hypothetical protein EPN91_00595 [Salinibacterium sp.]|nr:MAG: hypothetical protein EPN91_00595 [Salinibacterium sp.]